MATDQLLLIEKNPIFTQGALNSFSKDEIGKGWSINTPQPLFEIKTNEINLYINDGICFDLYNLVDIYPAENLLFEVDFTSFNSVSEYFNFFQSENLVNIFPTKKVIENNYPSNKFNLKVKCKSLLLNKELIGDLNINFNKDYTSIDKYLFEISYDTLNLRINLPYLFKTMEEELINNISIKTINSRPLEYYNLSNKDLINGSNLYLNKISEFNPKIVLEYKNNLTSEINLIQLNLINRKIYKYSTILRDIYINITPKDANFIDIKSFASGETYTLECEEFGNWSDNKALNYFNFKISKNFISVLPYTEDLIHPVTGLKESTIYRKTLKFKTKYTSGLFNIFITINMKNAIRNKIDYQFLKPTLIVPTLTISDNIITDINNPINLLGFIRNHYFPSKNHQSFDPLKNINDFKGTIKTTEGLEINNVNGINLYNTNTLINLNRIPFTIESILTSNLLEGYIYLKDDKPFFEEYFKPIEMIFNISKNSGEFLNVAEYIETDLENFNYLEIDKTSLNPNHFLDTQMLTLTLNPNLYENNIDLDEEILGEFTVKLKNKFIDLNTKDDFGNIIGLRKIPYKLIKSTERNLEDTSLELNIKDYRFYYNDINNTLINFGKDCEFLPGFDLNMYNNAEIFIEKLSINPETNIPVEFKNSGNDLNNKIIIDWEVNKIWTLTTNNLTTNLHNKKLVLDFEYLNKNKELKNYTQKIYFYKL